MSSRLPTANSVEEAVLAREFGISRETLYRYLRGAQVAGSSDAS